MIEIFNTRSYFGNEIFTKKFFIHQLSYDKTQPYQTIFYFIKLRKYIIWKTEFNPDDWWRYADYICPSFESVLRRHVEELINSGEVTIK